MYFSQRDTANSLILLKQNCRCQSNQLLQDQLSRQTKRTFVALLRDVHDKQVRKVLPSHVTYSDAPAWARPENRGFGFGGLGFSKSQARPLLPGVARPRPGFGVGRGFWRNLLRKVSIKLLLHGARNLLYYRRGNNPNCPLYRCTRQ